MMHPYEILLINLAKYSQVLEPEDIKQYMPNVFFIEDPDFDKLAFFRDVKKETNIDPVFHEYIGAKCSDKEMCFKPFDVYGFDNVLFYFKTKNF